LENNAYITNNRALSYTNNQERIVRWLADPVDTSADGETITFTLKKDIKLQILQFTATRRL
jgi:ABC-type transport system substrate-binding protein